MRPTTITVGPLAAPDDDIVCTSQTPTAAGQLIFATTSLSGLSTAQVAGLSSAQIIGSISGAVLTITSVPHGRVMLGMTLNGVGITAGTKITGFLTGTGGTGTYVVSINNTFSSGAIWLNGVVVLDTPRRVIITTAADESAKSFTIVGIGWNNQPQTEVLTPSALSTAQISTLDFVQISSVTASAATTGAIKVGTNGMASSRWMRMDEYAPGIATVQTYVSGTANYTVQVSMDDPNSPTNPVLPYLMNWSSSLDTNVVGATASKLSYFSNTPLWVRLLLNSNTNPGFVNATIAQSSNAPY